MFNVGDKVVALRSSRKSGVQKGHIYTVTGSNFGGPRPDVQVVCLDDKVNPRTGRRWYFYVSLPKFGPTLRKVIHDKPQAAVGNFADWFKTLEEVQ